MGRTSNGIPWTLAAMLAAALFVAVQARSRWMQASILEQERSLMLLDRIAADSCFLAGNYEEAFARYGKILLYQGDSMLLSDRKRRYGEDNGRTGDQKPSRRDLQEQLSRTERLLSRYKSMEAELLRGRERLSMEERQLKDVFGDRIVGQERELDEMRQEL
jgi:hypothetical protein